VVKAVPNPEVPVARTFQVTGYIEAAVTGDAIEMAKIYQQWRAEGVALVGMINVATQLVGVVSQIEDEEARVDANRN
jgi:hypothetical protein